MQVTTAAFRVISLRLVGQRSCLVCWYFLPLISATLPSTYCLIDTASYLSLAMSDNEDGEEGIGGIAMYVI